MHVKVAILRHKKTKATLTVILLILFAALTLVGPLATTTPADAQSLSEINKKITTLENKIKSNKNQIGSLEDSARTLEGAVAGIEAEIASINAEIELTELKIKEIGIKLDETRTELARQKEILGKSLREHYKVGEMTTVELFVASEDFADFFNQKEYLSRVRNSIKESSQEVARLEEELVVKEKKQNQLLDQQESQRQVQQSKRAEKQRLLEQTRGEQARYQSLVAQNSDALEAARAEQRRIILASQSNTITGGTGGYPWANVSPWNFNSCSWPKYVDDWGMCARQCVSYTAWKVHVDHLSGKARYDMPYWGGRGDAKKWPANARAAGIPTGSTPKVGSIAISTSGPWGHAMYVEAVNGDGSIQVSQYNAGLDGKFSYANRSGGGLTYIYFQDW